MIYAMFLPVFYWALPVYREPFWFETLISDFLGWTRYEISRIVNKSDVLMRPLNHPYWKFVDLFTLFIAINILFFIFEFWQIRCDRKAEETVYELPGDTPEMRSEPLPSTSGATTANTTSQPGTFVEHIQSISNSGTPGLLSPEDGKSVWFDAGKSSSRPQTPFTGSSSSFSSSSSSGSSISSSPRNVLDPKHTNPVSYYTRQKGMRLVEAWTPAKKDGNQDDDEYEIATLYDPPTKTYGTFRRRKNVGK
jgi:hypothetical protein